MKVSVTGMHPQDKSFTIKRPLFFRSTTSFRVSAVEYLQNSLLQICDQLQGNVFYYLVSQELETTRPNNQTICAGIAPYLHQEISTLILFVFISSASVLMAYHTYSLSPADSAKSK